MIRLFLSLLFLITFSIGCSLYYVDSQDVSTDFLPPQKSAEDVVYLEKIDRPHEVIGFITVNTERNQRINDVIEKMKREAAMLGADAITEIKTNSSGIWKKLPAQAFIKNGYVRANFQSSAVVFK